MSEKININEITNRALSILQSSDFTKTLESFSNEKITPTIIRLIVKRKKCKKCKKCKKS